MKKNLNLTTNIIWNTLGSIFYFGCQWLLNVSVVRFSSNFTNAGILSLAMSITGIFYVISLFNVRNFQVSDTDLYTPGDYIIHRILTLALSFVLCAIFVLINSYNLLTSISIIAFMILKLVEAFADVLHGEAQKHWRLDIAGKSCIIRGILLILVFTASLILWNNLPLSILLMSTTSIIPLILYDYRLLKRQIGLKIYTNCSQLLQLSKTCLPMVGYGLCINAIIPISKYFLEFYHGEETLGYYSTVSAVATLIQALVALIFTPLVGVFNVAYRNKDKKGMSILLAKLIILLIAITSLSMLFVSFWGTPLMVLIFGVEIEPYIYLLYPTIVISCLTALVWLMGMILVIMRSLSTLIIGAIIGLTLCLILCITSIPSTIYLGTNIAIIVALTVTSIIYIAKYSLFLLCKNNN